MIELMIPGKPMGKQRPRVMRNGITYTPKETVNYETLIKQLFAVGGHVGIFEGPLKMRVKAYFEISKSTPKKNIPLMIQGQIRPTKKPDMDNIIKIIADALNGIAYHDDSQIVQAYVEKFYDIKPRAEIQIDKLEVEEIV